MSQLKEMPRAVAWCMLSIVSVFYAYQYILRVMPNIMLPELMQQFHIDAAVFGQFSGLYYIGYALFILPLGLMLDRWGPRKVMTACILLTVVGMLPIVLSTHWAYSVIGRVLVGMGSSAAIIGAFKIIRMAFIEQRFTRMLSFCVTIGLLGAIYGGGPVSAMCDAWGYKEVVEIFAVMGVFLAVLTYWIVPDMHTVREGGMWADIKLVFGNGQVVGLCCLAGLMVGPLEGFADVWGSSFLEHVYHLESGQASYLPSMIFVGMCFGAPVLSLIAETTGRYLGAIVGAAVVMAGVFVTLLMGVLNVPTIMISFTMVGVCCAYQIIAIYKASTYVPVRVVGLTTAVANMIIMSFGYVFHTAMGLLIDAHGGATVSHAYVYGIGVIPLALGIAVIGLVWLIWHENMTDVQVSYLLKERKHSADSIEEHRG